MAKKAMKKAEPANKTKIIKEALEKNPNFTPAEIAATLTEYDISAQYVSTVKSNLKAKKSPKKAGTTVNLADLVKAKKLADDLGGVEKAKEMLDALSKLT